MTGGHIRGFQDTGYLGKKLREYMKFQVDNLWGRACLDQINGILTEKEIVKLELKDTGCLDKN